jgi:uncharacterized RmlC-like cupin family protein
VPDHLVPATTPTSTGALPAGVELYRLSSRGTVRRSTTGGTVELTDDPSLLRFIDDGQRAHYLIGDAGSGPAAPSTATVKIGIVAEHSAFSPHVHGAEHVVLSLGSAFCTLLHDDRPLEVALPPGCLLRIPAWLPHSFGNRAAAPLVIVAANTGLGIADDDYAVLADEAERRGGTDPAWARTAADLRALAGAGTPPSGLRDRVAAGLRRMAESIERVGVR